MSDRGAAVARALDRIAAIPNAVAGRTAADRNAPVDRTVVVDRIALADRIAPAVQSVEALSVAPPVAMNAPVAGRFAQAAEDEALASRSLMAWRAAPSDPDAVSFRQLPVARVTIRSPAERVVLASARAVCALGVLLSRWDFDRPGDLPEVESAGPTGQPELHCPLLDRDRCSY